MRRQKISLGNFMLLCLLIGFIGLYVFESQRAHRLEVQLHALAAPLKKEIEKLEWEVSKREKAYEFALASFQADMDLQATYEDPGAASDEQFPLGTRRELANLRNAKLKLDRERSRLKSLKDELENMLGPGKQ